MRYQGLIERYRDRLPVDDTTPVVANSLRRLHMVLWCCRFAATLMMVCVWSRRWQGRRRSRSSTPSIPTACKGRRQALSRSLKRLVMHRTITAFRWAMPAIFPVTGSGTPRWQVATPPAAPCATAIAPTLANRRPASVQ